MMVAKGAFPHVTGIEIDIAADHLVVILSAFHWRIGDDPFPARGWGWENDGCVGCADGAGCSLTGCGTAMLVTEASQVSH